MTVFCSPKVLVLLNIAIGTLRKLPWEDYQHAVIDEFPRMLAGSERHTVFEP